MSLIFKNSASYSLGVELELQIIDQETGELAEKSKELMRVIGKSQYADLIKPELIQTMIEVNSSVHRNCETLEAELQQIRAYMLAEAACFGLKFAGGGTHAFHRWKNQKIFPTLRYRRFLKKHGYLTQWVTVFGQHVHLGCHNADEAIYLTQALEPFLSHFIALSAASPFYHGIDTSFDSARLSIFSVLPTVGYMPYLKTWQEFSTYHEELCALGVIQSIKDLYWDIRPKAEFGTVELRICDTPLTLHQAVLLAAYAQALAAYLLEERPFELKAVDNLVHYYNRHQACRYGYEGNLVHSYTQATSLIGKDILHTLKRLKPYAQRFGTQHLLNEIKHQVKNQDNGAKWLREQYQQTEDFVEVVKSQATLWQEN